MRSLQRLGGSGGSGDDNEDNLKNCGQRNALAVLGNGDKLHTFSYCPKSSQLVNFSLTVKDLEVLGSPF